MLRASPRPSLAAPEENARATRPLASRPRWRRLPRPRAPAAPSRPPLGPGRLRGWRGRHGGGEGRRDRPRGHVQVHPSAAAAPGRRRAAGHRPRHQGGRVPQWVTGRGGSWGEAIVSALARRFPGEAEAEGSPGPAGAVGGHSSEAPFCPPSHEYEKRFSI